MNITKLNTKAARVKGLIAKVLLGGFLAAAVVVAAPAKAQAQEVYVGGGYYARHSFYERERIEAFRRHEAWVRAEEFRHFRHERFYRGYR